MYKSINVHLGPGTDNEHTNIPKIQIHLRKCWILYTLHNDFKILKILNKLSKFFTTFHRETSKTPIPSPNVHMAFLVDKIDMWRFPKLKNTLSVSKYHIFLVCLQVSSMRNIVYLIIGRFMSDSCELLASLKCFHFLGLTSQMSSESRLGSSLTAFHAYAVLE